METSVVLKCQVDQITQRNQLSLYTAIGYFIGFKVLNNWNKNPRNYYSNYAELRRNTIVIYMYYF